MTGIILSADIGTSSLKAALIDFSGRLRAFGRSLYEKDANGDVSAGAWERAFKRTLEYLNLEAPECVIDGICISGNGPTLVPVTAEGEAMRPLYWYDGGNLPLEKGSPSQTASGKSLFLPCAARFKKNAPALYEKTNLFVSSHEWLAARLGAGIVTILPSMPYEPYYWDDEQCYIFGLEKEKFPPFIRMGSLMGHISKEAESFFSPSFGNRLKSGTPIISGGPDFITALIGTKTQKPGDVCDRAGSSEGINVCTASPVHGEGLRVLPHAKEGLWNTGALIPSSGRLFENFRIETGQQDRDYKEMLDELIPSSFLMPDFPLPAPHTSIDSGRSVLCAMGFAVRSALMTLKKAGLEVSVMRLSGGQAKNARWNQLKADISGVSLEVPEIPDGELAGNAVLAASALENSSLEEAVGRIIRIKEVYRPGNAAL